MHSRRWTFTLRRLLPQVPRIRLYGSMGSVLIDNTAHVSYADVPREGRVGVSMHRTNRGSTMLGHQPLSETKNRFARRHACTRSIQDVCVFGVNLLS
jgi:hypothetical protein